MNRPLKVLLEKINAEINILNANNFKIFDGENPEFYVCGVYYNKETDQIYFKCEEEK